MKKKKRVNKIGQITASAEKVFGERPDHVTAPGGENRSSFRLHFRDFSVVATLRPNFQRTHLEAFTLRRLAPHCDDVPECLGVDGKIMFQSDVGERRLNHEIVMASPEARIDLASEAVATIFRIQRAGRQAGLEDVLPHLGRNRDWIENFVDTAEFLARLSEGRVKGIDKVALCERIDTGSVQFLKWDCRSGNAAIGPDDRMRWFDFEYSGIRHGAEDFAWLLGDEVWPLPPETMQEIITEAYDHQQVHELDAYLDYLALYTALHCVQRLKLIVGDAEKRGWISKRRVLKYDFVGTHPEFALQVCRVGAFFAARSPLTLPLARDFEEAERAFLGLLRQGLAAKQMEVQASC
ncbi:MAG: hypothetical protein RIG84_15740 [Roseovarius sp.]